MVNYGKPCYRDDDCPSKICEMTHVNGVADKRRCVLQQIKYGKKCNYNRDCDSNRCIMVLDANGKPKGKRCRIINGQYIPEKDWDAEDENDPEFTRSDKWKAAKNEEYILSNTQKRIAFEGRGPITEIIVLCMEIIIYILREIVKLVYSIWKLIFMVVSILPSAIFDKGYDGFSYKNRKDGKCIPGSYSITSETLVKIITLLFPPFGVFLDRGISGIGHIMITALLSAIFYFPGVIYAMMIIGDTLCPNSVELFSETRFKGKRFIFAYGDYSLDNDVRLDAMKVVKAKCGYADIGSVKLGKNVSVIFYENVDFTGEIIKISADDAEFEGKLDGRYTRKCMGKTVTKIKSISIRLKKPLPVLPETVDDDSVVFYLLNDFRGQNLILQKGSYNQTEVGKLFNGRISSMRVGKNMKVEAFEDINYNKQVITSFSVNLGGRKGINNKGGVQKNGVLWIGSGGHSDTFHGNTTYDTDVKGEIKNLAKYNFNDKIKCLIICKAGEPCDK